MLLGFERRLGVELLKEPVGWVVFGGMMIEVRFGGGC